MRHVQPPLTLDCHIVLLFKNVKSYENNISTYLVYYNIYFKHNVYYFIIAPDS